MRPETQHRKVINAIATFTQPFAVDSVVKATGVSRGTVLRVITRLRIINVLTMLPASIYGARHWAKLKHWPEDPDELIDKYESLRLLERSTGRRPW